MKRSILLICVLLTLSASAVFADTVSINFDDVQGGTQINNQYASLGVTFQCNSSSFGPCPSTASTNVYASSYNLALSGSNVLDITPGVGGVSNDGQDFIVGQFADGLDVTNVSIWAQPNCPDCAGAHGGPVLQIFGLDGALLDQFNGVGEDLGGNPWEQLQLSSSTAIGFFAVYDSNELPGSVFDNLSFTTGTSGGTSGGTGGGTGGGTTPVPEPSALVLLGSGLLGVFAKLRK